MENKTFVSAMAAKMDCSAEEVARMNEGFSAILRRECAHLSRVAIPGFGSFEGIKHDEEIRTDHASGRRMMFPPCIEVEFKPSTMLRKRINS